jgi:hypothetical protein
MLFRYVFVDFQSYTFVFAYFIEHIFDFSVANKSVICYINFIEHWFLFVDDMSRPSKWCIAGL